MFPIINGLEDNYIIALKFVLAIFLSGLIGFEREKIHRPAGLRTHIIVGIGSLIFGLLSIRVFPNDPARLLSGVVTGIGFLGAGTIFREKELISGLTTASSLWATAAVGLALSLNEYFIAIFGSLMVYGILQLKHFHWFRELLGYDEKLYYESLKIKPKKTKKKRKRTKSKKTKR